MCDKETSLIQNLRAITVAGLSFSGNWALQSPSMLHENLNGMIDE
jgi:hypothetical protein